MNRLLFLLGLVVTINSFSQPPVSTTELQFTSTASFSTTNGRIRYNSACNCFVFRYGGANVTPPLVAAPGAGQAGQSVRWNNGTTSWEYFTPTSSQGLALSVWGVVGNSVADNASIVASSDKQIMRREGNALAFGSIDLSASGAVGSSILAVVNGGTGSASAVWWPLTGTGTLTGNVNMSGAFSVGIGASPSAKLHVFGLGTTTGEIFRLADNTPTTRLAILDNGKATWTSSQNGNNTIGYQWNSTLTATANNDIETAYDFAATFNDGAFTPLTKRLIRIRDISSGTDLYKIENSSHNWFGGIFDFRGSSAEAIIRCSNNTLSIRGGSGTTTGIDFKTTFPSSTNNNIAYNFTGSTHDIVSGSGLTRIFKGIVINNTISSTNVNTITYTDLDINPTFSINGSALTHYGITVQSTDALNGFRTGAPTSTVHINGSIATGINTTSLTTNTTLNTTQEHWIFNTTGGNLTASLPDATTCIGRIYVITNISATNTLAVDPNGTQTINGSSSNYDITGTAYANVVIQSAGSLGWIIRATN